MATMALTALELESVKSDISKLQISAGVDGHAVERAARDYAATGKPLLLDSSDNKLLVDTSPKAAAWDWFQKTMQHGLDQGRKAWNWVVSSHPPETEPEEVRRGAGRRRGVHPQASLDELLEIRAKLTVRKLHGQGK
jgi:hypothetical protein